MISATTITRQYDNPDDTITLDETARHRRRIRMVSDGGIEFLLDLPAAQLLLHADGLQLDDGRIIEVRAAPEELYEVCATDPLHLLRIAWHMGNRHLPTQVMRDHIRIRRDHVIREMLEGLGALVNEIEAPFDPEGGAYGKHHDGRHHSDD